MQHEQCLVQILHAREQVLLGDVVEELAADAERPAGEQHLALALGADVGHLVLEQPGHVARVGRRRNGGNRPRLRDLAGRRQHGGAAEAMADQQRRRLRGAPQMVGGGDQISDV